MSKALYRKYRSKRLSELVGQKHITDILERAISTGHVSHAYLLTGPRGVGKTSVARIMAHEINGLDYDEKNINLDIIEIDAASNNGVEDVRDLREKVQIAPVAAKKKIYIIDEVHMLSKPAFNALLKTLEEPPEHVVFILATTNVEKLPDTIISRTQRFTFRPIKLDDAKKHLSYIAKKEGIKISDEALELIASRSGGSFRDSISLLDQMSGLIADDGEITADLIEDALGMAPTQIIEDIIKAVEARNVQVLVDVLDKVTNDGVDAAILVDQLTTYVSDHIAEKPQFIPLLDALIEVPKSSQPALKLLSTLGMFASQKQSGSKTVALAAPVLEVSASIKELERQATKPRPKEIKKSKITEPLNIESFDWNKLVEYTRQNYIALYSVLSKCSHELEGNVLTIYTANNFYKKKLDDTKYSPLLAKSLQEIGVTGLDVNTIPTTAPLKDSQAAAVAAIMGGGEEVSLEAV